MKASYNSYGAIEPTMNSQPSTTIERSSGSRVKLGRGREYIHFLANPGMLAALSAVAALAGTVLFVSNTQPKLVTNKVTSLYSEDASEINFTLSRLGYDPLSYFTDSKSELYNYAILDGYSAIIEPYATMHLEVFDDADSSVNKFRYTVCASDASVTCQHGLKYDADPNMATTIYFECKPYSTFSINVVEYNTAGDEIRSTTKQALCLYVRREIRDLNTADLNKMLDAMYTMWSVDEDEGQELYGEDYHSSTYFTKFHHFNAAWQDGDHIHEGNGFLTQHLKITNMFEKSMQAVDPSVTLPYWDFTIDHANGDNIISSFIMNADVFGSMPIPDNLVWGFQSTDSIEDAAIPDGRWAGLKADMNNDYDDLKFGYGYLRAPWNMNPSPYISRFTSDYMIGVSLPTCNQHYQVLRDSVSMVDFFVSMEDGPHATTHSLSGGIYGCDLMKPLLEAGYITDETGLKNICSKWVFYMKEFYRYNYLMPNSDCEVKGGNENEIDDEDLRDSVCGYTCDESSYTALQLNLKNKIEAYVPSDMSNEGWVAWRTFICEGDGPKIFSGDHLESASPADPSFWPIHPTLERLFQVRLMAGGFTDESWPSDAVNDYVCNKAQCYESELGSGRDYYDDCCYGHYEHDRLLNAVSGNRTEVFGLSNAEVVEMGDPRTTSYALEYIYDKFSWDHCEDEDFDELLTKLYENRNNDDDDDEDDDEEDDVTASPTHKPTHNPTRSPTQVSSDNTDDDTSSTSKPTFKPTKSPDYTPKPTHKPTKSPDYTYKPSAAPSVSGDDDDDDDTSTAKPTHKPTKSPDYTPKPTHKPTKSPDYTAKPTNAPSLSDDE